MEEIHIEETIIEARESILEKMFGLDIRGLRAPYARINHTMVKALERLGFDTIPQRQGLWALNGQANHSHLRYLIQIF